MMGCGHRRRRISATIPSVRGARVGGGRGTYLVGRAESMARAVVPEVLADLTGAFDAHGSTDGCASRAGRIWPRALRQLPPSSTDESCRLVFEVWASAGSATTRRARLTAARRDSHRTQSLNDDVRGRVQQSQPVAAGEPRGERALAAADSSPHPSGRRQRRPRGDARNDQQRQRRRGIVLGTRRGHSS